MLFRSVVYFNWGKIELVFGPGLSSIEKVSLQSAVQEWIAVRRSEERRVGKECRCRWSPDH